MGRIMPERAAVDALTAAGFTAGVKTPNPRPPKFLRLFLRNGSSGFVRTDVIEVESWAPNPVAAWEQLIAAYDALVAATGAHGIRRVTEDSAPSSLPTGEDGWERYRMAVAIDSRPTRT